MSILSIPDYISQISAHNPLQVTGEYVRQEIKALATELKEVETQIAAVKAMIYGVSVLYGAGIVDENLLQSVRPQPRTNKRGLTSACRSVLKHAERPFAVSEICTHVNELNPELLSRHRKPMASVMSALRSLERRQQVVRGREGGRSVWQLADSPSAQQAALAKAQGCFQ